eukprot:4300856-Amphidinium_carterae.2
MIPPRHRCSVHCFPPRSQDQKEKTYQSLTFSIVKFHFDRTYDETSNKALLSLEVVAPSKDRLPRQ